MQVVRVEIRLYWIEEKYPGRIAILPRPRGGEWLADEVRAWKRSGIEVVVSLLTADEVTDLDLLSEADLCREFGIEFVSYPISDRGVPGSVSATKAMVALLAGRLADGRTVGVHCRQGIGRSALVVAAVLTSTGLDSDSA